MIVLTRCVAGWKLQEVMDTFIRLRFSDAATRADLHEVDGLKHNETFLPRQSKDLASFICSVRNRLLNKNMFPAL